MKNTRKFKDSFEMRDFFDAFALAKELIKQIDTYDDEESLSPAKREFLSKSKKYIEGLLRVYEEPLDYYNKIEHEIMMYCMQHMDEDDRGRGESVMKRAIDASKTFNEIKGHFNRVFRIEDTIQEHITIPLWKQYITPADKELKPGDKFLYLVHSGIGIIQLPGFPGFEEIRDYKDDYVSASLLSEEQAAMFNGSKVGLILKANEAIACSTRKDSGSHFVGKRSIRTILVFSEDNATDSGIPALLAGKVGGITSKIQTPKQLNRETVEAQRESGRIFSEESADVNEVVLNMAQVEVVGVFFKTNGCEINLEDFQRAVIMSEIYGVPIRIDNTAICRKNMGLAPYRPEDVLTFEKQVQYWGNEDNWKDKIEDPILFKELLKRYYEEVVIKQEYEPKIQKKIEEVFAKMMDISFHDGCEGKNIDDAPSIDE